MNYNTEATLQGIGQLHFNGHIIPHTWFAHIKLPSGKPDLIAIMIMADIVYWYRPHEIKNEYSGELLGFKKKFKADMLQRNSRAYSKLYGISQRQASDAIRRLCEQGLIIREYRTIETLECTLSNVQFLAPIVEAIANIQVPKPLLADESSDITEDEKFFPVNPNHSASLTPSKTTSTGTDSEPHFGHDKKQGTLVTITGKKEPISLIKVPAIGIESPSTGVIVNHSDRNQLDQQQANRNEPLIPAAELMIGTVLSPKQQHIIANRVQELFSQKLIASSQQITAEIQFALLSNKHFTQCQQDFYKKLNTICKYIRIGKWTSPPELLVKPTKANPDPMQLNQQKWRELQIDHQHWNKMLKITLEREHSSSNNIDSIKQLVHSTHHQLVEFKKTNNLAYPLPAVFL